MILLNEKIRNDLMAVSSIDKNIKFGMSPLRINEIDRIVSKAKQENPEMFFTDIIKNGLWVGKF